MHHCLNWPSSRNLIPVWNSAPSLPKLADPSPRHVGGTRRKTSMENICQKTPLQNTWHRARGTPWKEVIFQLSCFSIYHNNAQWLSCTALPFDGCRNCCSCLHCVKFAEQVLHAVAQGNSGCQNLVHATHWPRATKVRHTGSLLYFRFPTYRSAELDADRCAKSTPQLH